MISDPAGRLLILKPTYKKGWTIPGGQIDAEGESPWDACRRETREECGLVVEQGRLACVDYLPPKPSRPGGVRFLFDCGTLPAGAFASIVLQEVEIEDFRLARLEEALELPERPSAPEDLAVRRPRGLPLPRGRPPGSGRGLAHRITRSRRPYVEQGVLHGIEHSSSRGGARLASGVEPGHTR